MTLIAGWGSGVSLPLRDGKTRRVWMGAVHAALRATAPPGQVRGEPREPGSGWNYYFVPIAGPGGQPQRLLLNAAARLVACASDEDGSLAFGPLRFCPVPSPHVFTAAGFDVGSVEEMTRELRPEHVAALTPQEQADIAYHRPGTIGDVLFNWFD